MAEHAAGSRRLPRPQIPGVGEGGAGSGAPTLPTAGLVGGLSARLVLALQLLRMPAQTSQSQHRDLRVAQPAGRSFAACGGGDGRCAPAPRPRPAGPLFLASVHGPVRPEGPHRARCRARHGDGREGGCRGGRV